MRRPATEILEPERVKLGNGFAANSCDVVKVSELSTKSRESSMRIPILLVSLLAQTPPTDSNESGDGFDERG